MSIFDNGEPITIQRRTGSGFDGFGNPTYTLADVAVAKALIAFNATSEPVGADRDAVDAKATAYLPTGTLIQEGDVFLIRDQLWLKDGEPESWTNPYMQFDAGVVVQLRRRNG